MLDVKKLLSKILDVFSTTSTTITGSYNLKAVAYRRCGIVTLNVWQTATANLPKGQWITVGTLPAQYRPVQQFDALGPDNNTSSVQNNSLQMRINTGGNVMVWAYSNGVTTNQLLASLTYIGGGYCITSLLSTIERWWRYVRCEKIDDQNACGCTGIVIRFWGADCIWQLLQISQGWQGSICMGSVKQWLEHNTGWLSCSDYLTCWLQTIRKLLFYCWCHGWYSPNNWSSKYKRCVEPLYNCNNRLLGIFVYVYDKLTTERGCMAC